MAEPATHRLRAHDAEPDRAQRAHIDRTRAVLARDAALARIGRTRITMLVVAAALTALLAALASALLPGKSLGAKNRQPTVRIHAAATTPRHSTHRAKAVAPRMPAPAGPAQLGLQGPAQAPQSTPPPVQSSPPPSSSQPPSQPSPPAQPAPAPAAPSGGGAVVSGGS